MNLMKNVVNFHSSSCVFFSESFCFYSSYNLDVVYVGVVNVLTHTSSINSHNENQTKKNSDTNFGWRLLFEQDPLVMRFQHKCIKRQREFSRPNLYLVLWVSTV